MHEVSRAQRLQATLSREFPASCEHCRYSLRGSRESDVCPECGRPHGGEAYVLKPIALPSRADFLFAIACILGFIALIKAVFLDWIAIMYVAGATVTPVIFIMSLSLVPAAFCVLLGMHLRRTPSYSHSIRLTNHEVRIERWNQPRIRFGYEHLKGFTLEPPKSQERWLLTLRISGHAGFCPPVFFKADEATAKRLEIIIIERMRPARERFRPGAIS